MFPNFNFQVEASETFDTEIDGGASKAMSNFIESLPEGKVILMAIRGNAAQFLMDDAYKTMVIITVLGG